MPRRARGYSLARTPWRPGRRRPRPRSPRLDPVVQLDRSPTRRDERLERQALAARRRRELDLLTLPLTPRPDERVDAAVVDLADRDPAEHEPHRQPRADRMPLQIARMDRDRP